MDYLFYLVNPEMNYCAITLVFPQIMLLDDLIRVMLIVVFWILLCVLRIPVQHPPVVLEGCVMSFVMMMILEKNYVYDRLYQ